MGTTFLMYARVSAHKKHGPGPGRGKAKAAPVASWVNSPQPTPQGAHLNALGCSQKFRFLLCLTCGAGPHTDKDSRLTPDADRCIASTLGATSENPFTAKFAELPFHTLR